MGRLMWIVGGVLGGYALAENKEAVSLRHPPFFCLRRFVLSRRPSDSGLVRHLPVSTLLLANTRAVAVPRCELRPRSTGLQEAPPHVKSISLDAHRGTPDSASVQYHEPPEEKFSEGIQDRETP